MVIVPNNLLDDLKSFPEESISFRADMYDRFLGKYTSVAANTEAMVNSVKFDLTRGLGTVIPIMQEEAEYARRKYLDNSDIRTRDAEGWSRALLYPLVAQMIALVSGRVFVGLPLSRNDEWYVLQTELQRWIIESYGSPQAPNGHQCHARLLWWRHNLVAISVLVMARHAIHFAADQTRAVLSIQSGADAPARHRRSTGGE